MAVKHKVLERMLGSSDKFSDKQIAQTVQLLLEHGVKRGASSVHIEPHENYDAVRYRIDGALRGMHKLPRAAHGLLMQQLKKLAQLDKHTTTIPQEGRFEAEANGQKIQVDVSIMPVFGGEKAVLHLNLQTKKPAGLAQLGFWGEGLVALQTALTQPHGLIVVAGPRRTGVSTTLHSLLDTLNSPSVSIATMESRVSRHIAGATQIQIPHNTDQAANQLVALFGHDPNIVMIDRMPTKAVGQQAVEGAIRGHVVLAGIHADDAIDGILRMRSMGIEPYMLASVLRAGVGQRLVRKLCSNCRERHELDTSSRTELEAKLGLNTESRRIRVHELEQEARQTGMNDSPLCSKPTHITHIWRAGAGGCDNCNHTGYNGMVALTEVLVPGNTLRDKLASPSLPPATTIRQTALKQGFVPLALDGVIKGLRGQTTIEEVLRTVAP